MASILFLIIPDFLILAYTVCAAPFPRSEGLDSSPDSVLSRQVLTAIVVALCISIFAVSLFLAASGCKIYRRRPPTSAPVTSSYRNRGPNNGPQMERITRQISVVDAPPLYESHRLPAYPADFGQAFSASSFSDHPSTLHPPPPIRTKP
ncbi:hypothetical protein J3R30DRAFT_3700021 [Lentinula aciculospora]|uniref:Transmembrane protein n=1 Tax=Lentinula aciculospora TaxID=153920 RepID=A0A9W9AH42_9AGAR|nr:hypothetical protein J3R30DRAFT_3700021 [Lentinula aciculospora]